MKFRQDLPQSDGGNYVRLKDKESVTGIFYGEPYDFSCVWENKSPKEVPPGTPGAKFRFKINFIVKEGSAYVVKIFENSKTVYEQMGLLHSEYDLEKTVVKITRTGSTMADTAYNIMPLRDPVPPQTTAVLKTLKLNDFGAKHPGPSDDIPFGEPPFEDSSELPF